MARRVRDGGGEYATTASGKSVFCARNGFRVSTVMERRHVRLIRLISGPLGFAAAREAAVGEIAGARRPSRKKADFREYCKRPATRRGGVRRYLRSARGHKSSEAPEFGPTRYGPGTIMQSLSMRCRGTGTRASVAAGGRPAGRRTKGTRPTPPSRCGQGAAWP